MLTIYIMVFMVYCNYTYSLWIFHYSSVAPTEIGFQTKLTITDRVLYILHHHQQERIPSTGRLGSTNELCMTNTNGLQQLILRLISHYRCMPGTGNAWHLESAHHALSSKFNRLHHATLLICTQDAAIVSSPINGSQKASWIINH